MGVTIRQKKRAGPYWVFVNHDGRRTSKSVGTRKAALELKPAIEAEIAKGSFSIDAGEKMPTFGRMPKSGLSATWNGLAGLRRSTIMRAFLRIHVLPAFKSKPLDQISRGDIRDFLFAKAKTLSIKYVLLVKDVLSGVLGWALDEGLITANPAIGATKKLFKRDETGKKAETQDEVWNEAELEAFLETCREREPAFYPLFLTLARTGCRLGEALALKWIGVDFAERVLSIRESYRRGRLTPPRTGKPARWISRPACRSPGSMEAGKVRGCQGACVSERRGRVLRAERCFGRFFWKVTKAARGQNDKVARPASFVRIHPLEQGRERVLRVNAARPFEHQHHN